VDQELIQKITEKKEFSRLPKKDVEIAFKKFDKERNKDYQKLKLTRNFLRKIYSSFSSRKLFGKINKEKEISWFLSKHKSTKERLPFYGEVYKKIFLGFGDKEVSIIDLGAGINGLSYDFFPVKISYVGVEAVGQLVDLMNNYFKKEKKKGIAIHESLFEIEKIKKIIAEQKKPRIILLFKVIDSLESMERDYSKKLLNEITPLAERVVLSFATRSLGKRSKFSANRNWILKFLKENFSILDDFEMGGERYLVFEKK
jgi:hypothetical protein